MILGVIKTCRKCGSRNYIRTGEKCPECGNDFEIEVQNQSPDIIVYLGSAEISRRSVEWLHSNNYIDDPRK